MWPRNLYPFKGSPVTESSGIKSSLSGLYRAVNPFKARLESICFMPTLGYRVDGFSTPNFVYDQRASENPPANRPRAGREANAIRDRSNGRLKPTNRARPLYT